MSGTIKDRMREWFLAGAKATIQGAATAGMSWMSVNGANAAGADVPQLNAKALGLITLSGAVASIYRYLSTTPLPVADEDNKDPGASPNTKQ